MSRMMPAWLLSIFVLALRFCPAAEPAKQAPKRITISGQVVHEQSQGVAGVKITALICTDVIRVSTDTHGHFTFDVAGRDVPVILANDPGTDRLGVYASNFKPPIACPPYGHDR